MYGGGQTAAVRGGADEGEGSSSVAEILQSLGHVAEGVSTTAEVMRRARIMQVEMPITFQVDQVLSHGKSAQDAVMDLLGRDQKSEEL